MSKTWLAILLYTLLACACAWGQRSDVLFFESAIETPHHVYHTSWVCRGDTLQRDTTERYGAICRIDGFWIMQIEMTVEFWQWFKNRVNDTSINPVAGVSVSQVDSLCQRLMVDVGGQWRLPTREEWLFAYRGGLFDEGYTYSGSNNHTFVAWSSSNSGGRLHPGGRLIPNDLNLYDMAGNLCEMVTDGDSVAFIGGSYLDDLAAQPIPLRQSPPAETRGLRLVKSDPQWINAEGNRVFP